ncbi:MAG TPA: hypothetical protein VFF33_14850 [Ignavibacteriaceae bacterium]|nr:hypothetical protein [Ignavibacteriaceae bacterium]
MKNIRNFAALILSFSGVLHVIAYILNPDYSAAAGLLVFGIVYLIVGMLLFLWKSDYSLYLGVIIPLVGSTLSIIKFGVPDLISLSALFKVLSLGTIICCVYLLSKQKKILHAVYKINYKKAE